MPIRCGARDRRRYDANCSWGILTNRTPGSGQREECQGVADHGASSSSPLLSPGGAQCRPRGSQRVAPADSGPRPAVSATLAIVALVAGGGRDRGVIAAEHTSHGRSIVSCVQDFLLKYMGVFALIGLTTAVGVGLLATDRIVMRPGHRVVAQAVHRGVSLGRAGRPGRAHRAGDHRAPVGRHRRGRPVPGPLPHPVHRPRHRRLGPVRADRRHGLPARPVRREAGRGPGAPSTPSPTWPGRCRSCTACWAAGRPSRTWTGATAPAWPWSPLALAVRFVATVRSEEREDRPPGDRPAQRACRGR